MMRPSSPSQRPTGPFDLSRTPIHLGSRVDAADPAVPLEGFGFDGPAFESYVARHCAPGAPGRLIMVGTTPRNWSAWECHPEGDEIVIVLEGRAVFMQDLDGQLVTAPVGPGSTMINPAGVWHTADVEAPMKAIYITPCPGTKHRPR
jgi:quercetin dioxygenase-like cupin family protein